MSASGIVFCFSKHLVDTSPPDHAVSASVTYLIRSLGAVWGVALTSAILQTTLSTRLPDALGGVENKEEVSLRVNEIPQLHTYRKLAYSKTILL